MQINQRDTVVILFFIGISILAILIGGIVSKTATSIAFAIVGVILILIISFINTEASLYILILSMLLSPELMIEQLGGSDVAGRGVTFRIEDLLLIVIGFSWLAKMAIYKELNFIAKSPLNKPISVYILVFFLSTVTGITFDRVDSKTGLLFILKYIEYYIIYFMVINNLESKRQIKRFIIVIFITCLIISIIGILQIPGGTRVSAPFEGERGEPNTLGGYLILILSIAIGLILTIKNRVEKKLLIGLCLIIIPPFLYTLSRSSWIALIPMLVVLIFFTEKKAMLIGSTVLIILLGSFMIPESVEERIQYTFSGRAQSIQTETVFGISFDSSTSARITRFKYSFKNWTKHPIIGWGVTGAGFIDGQYNRILEETGLLGLFGFLWLIYSIFKHTLRSFRESDDLFLKGLSLGMLAAIPALLGHALGSNTFIIVRIMEPFWLLVGIVISIPRIIETKPTNIHPGL